MRGDLPSLGAVHRPWTEPGVYRGPANTVPPLMAYDGGEVGSLTVRAGSVAAEKRRPWRSCNDSFAVRTDEQGGVCLLAVADGVGEAHAAGRAARLATALTVQAWRERWDADAGRTAAGLESTLRAALADVEATLADRGGQDEEFRTALAVAVLATELPTTSRGRGSVPTLVARVGDCTAWRHRGGALEPVFPLTDPPAGGPTPTLALPGHLHRVELQHLRLGDGELLALTTDGLAAGVPGEAAVEFLRRAWAFPPTPLEFLATLGVRREDRDDDRAAAVVWTGPDPGPGAGNAALGGRHASGEPQRWQPNS